MPLLLLAHLQGGALRITYVSLDKHPHDACHVWPLVHLIDGGEPRPPYPRVRTLPTDTRWTCGFFDCCFGSVAGLPFHLLACRYELMLVALTVLLLRGWPTHHCLSVLDVVTGDGGTRFTISAQAQAQAFNEADPLLPPWLFDEDGEERSEVSLALFDRQHELLLTHRMGEHVPISLVPLTGLSVHFDCVGCGQRNPGVCAAAPGPPVGEGCVRCGYHLTTALLESHRVPFGVVLRQTY